MTQKKQKNPQCLVETQQLLQNQIKKIGWTNLHYSLSNYNQNQSEIMKDLVLLDSDSTNTIFCNEAYVSDIREL